MVEALDTNWKKLFYQKKFKKFQQQRLEKK